MTQRGQAVAAAGAVTGGVLWALTPLRDVLVGAGGDPRDGLLAFRLYNLLVAVIATLLVVALVELRRRLAGRMTVATTLAWATMLVGHTLLLLGSLAAVLLASGDRELVRVTQDAGFLGAMLAALAALPLGLIALRRRLMPAVPAALFASTLVLGLLGTALLSALSVTESIVGLPLTLLYGAAWLTLGLHWWKRQAASAAVQQESRALDGGERAY